MLIVEDNAINQLVTRGMLLKLGYRVRTADNGAEALEMLRSEPIDAVRFISNVSTGATGAAASASTGAGRPSAPICGAGRAAAAVLDFSARWTWGHAARVPLAATWPPMPVATV